MKTRITELLGIQYPIIQGGMAWVAEHHLAAAVSAAGGLGLIGGANAPGEVVREEIRKARELTDKPIGVNVMLLSPHADDVARVVVEEGIKVVTTGAGNPEKYMDMWKAAGIKVIPVVASVALAKRMEKYGADAVVAEGMESGGHIGEQTTMTLVPQVVDAVSIPVIAAGGIADGRGIAAAFMLGAEAVQIGTRFVVSKESIVHENYKQRIIKAKDIDSTVTGRTHGHPVRCLRNQMTREYIKLEQEGKSFEELEYLTLGTLRKAVQEGDVTNGTVMAGQIAGMITKEQTCKEMIDEMMEQAEAPLTYTPLIMSERLYHLVTSMPEFLAEENPCSKYIDLKCKELVFLITNFYPLPQLGSFFYPISTYTESFHYFVMQNYSKVKNVEEFAHLGGYTTTTFRRLFKNLYGVPVYEWILEKKREGILEDLQHTKMRITEICNRYGFDSLSHFAHFCKDSFGDTPRALRKKAAGGEKIGKVQ